MEVNIFSDIGLILGITIAISLFAQIMKQPLIVAYIVSGIICGPLLLNLVGKSHSFFEVFAQFGVILLLFLVGLNLNFDYLRRVGKVSFVTGIGQVLFTVSLGLIILLLMGFDNSSALYLATAITFSSTIIITKLLSDKKEIDTTYGRYTVGLMLVQDLIAIVVMILLVSFSGNGSLAESFLSVIIKGCLLVAIVYSLSRFVLPKVMNRIALSSEFLLIFTIAWCFGIAGLSQWAGLSLEIGAIAAGISLGTSSFQTEIVSRIKPLRDFFIVIFFIILGSTMNMDNLVPAILPGLILSIFVLIGNPFILYLLFRFMKFTRRNSFMAGITAAQVSEFGFVILFVGKQLGYVSENVLASFTIVALVTIFFSSYMITYNHQLYNIINPFLNLFGKEKLKDKKQKKESYEVLVFGCHRIGWRICDILKKKKVKFAVVDFDPSVVKKLEKKSIPYFFGDSTDIDFLSELPTDKTKMIISTLPNAEDQITMISYFRKRNKKMLIIATLSFVKFLDDMYRAGADYVLVPHLLSSQWISGVLAKKPWTKKTMANLFLEQKREMRIMESIGGYDSYKK